MTGQREFLEQLVGQLEKCSVAFMVTGSIASSFHGEPRATRDVDLVIDCSGDQLAALLEAVQQQGWYVDPAAAMAAHAERAMFNIIDPASGWKADLIVRKTRDFSLCEFQRRITASVFGPDSIPVKLSTPEDTILSKLEWAGSAASEQQHRDALAVAILRRRQLDRDYLRRWAEPLGVSDRLERLLEEADESGPGTWSQ